MTTTNTQLGAWAEALGHTAPAVYPTKSGARFYGTCSCGYRTTTRTSVRLAADGLIHHMYKAIKAARAAGWEPPATAGGDTPERVKLRDRAAAGL